MKTTALREAIQEIKDIALKMPYKDSEYWNCVKCINILESKLEKEKQDLQIQYALGYDEGFNDGNLEK